MPPTEDNNALISKCPFGKFEVNDMDVSPSLSIEVGLEQITSTFWRQYGDIILKSYTPENEERKKWQFGLHRKAVSSFVREHPGFQGEQKSCPFSTIYDRGCASAKPVLTVAHAQGILPRVIGWLFIRELRDKITEEAIRLLQPGNVLEQGVADNIIGPLAPWECTIMSIIEFYERHKIAPNVFLQAWDTIVKVNSIIGMHLATRHISCVGNQLIGIIGDSGNTSPYFSISIAADNQLKITWRENAVAEIIGILGRQDWKAILDAPNVRKGPINVCPAALVKTHTGQTVVELGVEKIGNSIYGALFQN